FRCHFEFSAALRAGEREESLAVSCCNEAIRGSTITSLPLKKEFLFHEIVDCSGFVNRRYGIFSITLI
ncbi:hypothetical protein JQ310_19800, partial [Leptospira interrogans]|nr:hypothetical protein [Leptospira interrogans]